MPSWYVHLQRLRRAAEYLTGASILELRLAPAVLIEQALQAAEAEEWSSREQRKREKWRQPRE